MSNKGNQDNDGKDDDDALWAYVTRDVEPLEKKKSLSSKTQSAPQKSLPAKKLKEPKASAYRENTPASKATEQPKSAEIDRRTDDRLRKGQMPINARLDLHGLRTADAHEKLHNFILNAHNRGQRTLLVITGKGRAGGDPLGSHKGKIKNALPIWLGEPALKNLVLKTYPAKGKDGGSGAFYVYLRRKRS